MQKKVWLSGPFPNSGKELFLPSSLHTQLGFILVKSKLLGPQKSIIKNELPTGLDKEEQTQSQGHHTTLQQKVGLDLVELKEIS